MRRRQFIAGLGSAAMVPTLSVAQQPGTPVIGFLTLGSRESRRDMLAAFSRGLRSAGYVEGRTVTIEYRGAEGRGDGLPTLAAELVQRQVTVIVATGTLAVLTAKAATSTIPIVFALGADPVKFGLVASLNQPGGNATGVSFLVNSMMSKQFEILHLTVPKTALVGFLVNPINPNTDADTADVMAAAASLEHKVLVVRAGTEREIDEAVKTLVRERADALLVHNDPFFLLRREQIVALTAYQAIPAMYAFRDFTAVGGLMSYGTDLADAYRVAGEYSGRILKGEKPADLPVVQSTKFELVINLKTAKALGLTIPETLLATADEVIQ